MRIRDLSKKQNSVIMIKCYNEYGNKYKFINEYSNK